MKSTTTCTEFLYNQLLTRYLYPRSPTRGSHQIIQQDTFLPYLVLNNLKMSNERVQNVKHERAFSYESGADKATKDFQEWTSNPRKRHHSCGGADVEEVHDLLGPGETEEYYPTDIASDGPLAESGRFGWVVEDTLSNTQPSTSAPGDPEDLPSPTIDWSKVPGNVVKFLNDTGIIDIAAKLAGVNMNAEASLGPSVPYSRADPNAKNSNNKKLDRREREKRKTQRLVRAAKRDIKAAAKVMNAEMFNFGLPINIKLSETLDDMAKSGKFDSILTQFPDLLRGVNGVEKAIEQVTKVGDKALKTFPLFLVCLWSLWYWNKTRSKVVAALGLISLVAMLFICNDIGMDTIMTTFGSWFEKLTECWNSKTDKGKMRAEMDVSDVETFGTLGATLCTLYATGSAPKDNMLKAFKREIIEFPRFKAGIKESFSSITQFMVKAMNWVCEHVLCTDTRFSSIKFTDPEINKWTDRVIAIKKESIRGLPLTLENMDRIELLKVMGHKLMAENYTLKSDLASRQNFVSFLNTLKEVEAPFAHANIRGNAPRPEPPGFLFVSDPGNGKSYGSFPAIIQLLRLIVPTDMLEELERNYMNFIFAVPSESEYWEGYWGQLVALMDDFLLKRDTLGADGTDPQKLTRMINIVPYPLNMANVNNKGIVNFQSKIVVGTTTIKNFNPENVASINDVGAVTRRWHLAYYVVPKVEFATTESLTHESAFKRILDQSKAKNYCVMHGNRVSFAPEVYEYIPLKLGDGTRSRENTIIGPSRNFNEIVLEMKACYDAKMLAFEKYSKDLIAMARGEFVSPSGINQPMRAESLVSDLGAKLHSYWKEGTETADDTRIEPDDELVFPVGDLSNISLEQIKKGVPASKGFWSPRWAEEIPVWRKWLKWYNLCQKHKPAKLGELEGYFITTLSKKGLPFTQANILRMFLSLHRAYDEAFEVDMRGVPEQMFTGEEVFTFARAVSALPENAWELKDDAYNAMFKNDYATNMFNKQVSMWDKLKARVERAMDDLALTYPTVHYWIETIANMAGMMTLAWAIGYVIEKILNWIASKVFGERKIVLPKELWTQTASLATKNWQAYVRVRSKYDGVLTACIQQEAYGTLDATLEKMVNAKRLTEKKKDEILEIASKMMCDGFWVCSKEDWENHLNKTFFVPHGAEELTEEVIEGRIEQVMEAEGQSGEKGQKDGQKSGKPKKLTYKTSKGTREAMKGELLQMTAEMLDDGATEKLVQNLYNRNMYAIHPPGMAEKCGYFLFVDGTFGIFPKHYLTVWKHNVERGKWSKNDTVELRALAGAHSYRIPLKEFLLSKDTTAHGSNDISMMKIPRHYGVQPHAKIISKFFRAEDLPRLNHLHAMVLVCPKPKTNMVYLTDTVRRADAEAHITAEDGTVFDYKIRYGYDYMAQTSPGDCGAPALADINMCEGRRILGIHVSGWFHEGHQQKMGFASAVTQEELIQTMEELGVDSFTVVKDEGHSMVSECLTEGAVSLFRSLGKSDKPLYVPNVTSIRKSMLFGKIAEIKTAPARLSPFWKDGELIDPMEMGLRKYVHSPVAFDKDTVEACVSHMWSTLWNNSPIKRKGRVFTFREAVEGIAGQKFVDGVTRSTSAGWPYVLEPKPGFPGKTRFFGKEGPYDFDNPEARALEGRVMSILEDAARGVRQLHVCTVFKKDERRLLAKVEAGKTRLIFGQGSDLLIACRMMLMDFCVWMMENRVHTESCVGINPYSDEWERLAKALLELGGDMFAGDYECFDGKAQPFVMWCLLILINNFYGNDPIGNLQRTVLWMEICNSRHLVGIHIIEWILGLPSGTFVTTIINVLRNMFYFRLAFVLVMGCLAALASFNDHVVPKVYGDDNVAAISRQIRDVFNAITMSQALKKCNMVYTDESKGQAMVPYKTIQEVTFLKRGFRYEPLLDRHVAPLDLDVVLELPCWTKKGLDWIQITKDNVDTSLIELSLHGEEVFNKWAPTILEASKKELKHVPIFATWSGCIMRASKLEDAWW